MTKKERIAELEKELADVKRRLDVLEGWRIVFPSEPQIAPYEPCYVQPTRWWERQPQTGDPLPPITITVSGAV